jgi:hypothetical protein
MRFHSRFAAALAAGLLLALQASAQAPPRATTAAWTGSGFSPSTPRQLCLQTAVVVVGKVVEVEKESVFVSRYRGAPKDQKIEYKIATVRIEEPLIGGRGLTQFRVGFPADASAGALPPLPGRGPLALAPDQEGCFFLNPHHEGDFYVLANGSLIKSDKNYAKELEDVKKVAKILDDPVAALKAKDMEDRFRAASVLLERYRTNHSGKPATREAIPAEENKLILTLLQELPWQSKDTKPRPASDPVAPSRSALWYTIQQDLVGFKQPAVPPGTQIAERNKIWEDATTAYLKDNIEKIKLKGYTK